MAGLPLSSGNRRYGARVGQRGTRYTFHKPPQGTYLPTRFSIEEHCGWVKDQGTQGSCTAHGSISEREFIARKFKQGALTLSPSFVYYQERLLEGTLADGDCGAQVVTGLEVLNQFGAPLLSEEPYDENVYELAPTAAQLQEALSWKGGAPLQIQQDLADIKATIHSGFPFVIGINVFSSFESDAAAATGLIPFPDMTSETLLGGHEVLAGVAWDDDIQCPNSSIGALKFQNSWGTDWGCIGGYAGTRGFGWIPYEYILSATLTTDVRMSSPLATMRRS